MIQALNGQIQTPWQISNIINDIRIWQTQGIQLLFTHIFREANMAADWHFKFGHTISTSYSSDICFSPSLKAILAADVVGRTLVRRGA